MLRFTDELIARVHRAGASGVKLLRADSGFWNVKVFKRLEQAELGILDRRPHAEGHPARRLTRSRRNVWQPIEDYPEEGEAQIAETTYNGRRLIVNKTFACWASKHSYGLTGDTSTSSRNRTDELQLIEAEHRDHAVVEQVIADLKDQALAHFLWRVQRERRLDRARRDRAQHPQMDTTARSS